MQSRSETTRLEEPMLRGLPRSIWMLGLVSLFMDSSSELIHSLLPLFLVGTLGASTVTVGLIEGIGEATASITKVFSGTLSDWLRHRKWLTVLGYGLAALTKPLFPLATTVGWILTARTLDRVGKGIRGAPRDALVADIAPKHLLGAAYGLRQSLDTIGAVAGPLLAVALMALLANDIRAVFWFAVIPAVLAVLLLVLGVREPARPPAAGGARPPIRWAQLGGLGRGFWAVVGVGSVLTLARFSEAFLVLKAQDTGLALALVPLVMVVMNVAYAVAAYPAGVLSDRAGRDGVLRVGVALLVAADLVLALATGPWMLAFGVVLWGLHMGLTQGLLSTMVAEATGPEIKGTAFGIFNLITGVMLLVASLLAGWLWQVAGPAATFLAGAAFTTVALAGLVAVGRQRVDGGGSAAG
jgi:MFS family permease